MRHKYLNSILKAKREREREKKFIVKKRYHASKKIACARLVSLTPTSIHTHTHTYLIFSTQINLLRFLEEKKNSISRRPPVLVFLKFL